MNRRMSEICAKYDLAYWVWTPADFDLKDEAKRAAALKAHEELYADCPRLDGVFFPGGDPGDNHPSDVMPFLEEVSKLLLKHHPAARVWISPQGFDGEKLDAMFRWIDEHKPAVARRRGGRPGKPAAGWPARASGPAVSPAGLSRHHAHRPLPVPGVEPGSGLRADPGPRMHHGAARVLSAKVHALTAPFTDGFISYSDGVHDDANKILWSQLGWDSSRDPRDIMIDYCRFFFGPGVAVQAADGLFALEKNWDGPIRHNGAIEGTLALWKNLEAANPELKDNWRWQMYVLRAYYDAYTRERLFREQALEQEANALLARTPDRTPAEAMKAAMAILRSVDAEPDAAGPARSHRCAVRRPVPLDRPPDGHEAVPGERAGARMQPRVPRLSAEQPLVAGGRVQEGRIPARRGGPMVAPRRTAHVGRPRPGQLLRRPGQPREEPPRGPRVFRDAHERRIRLVG